MQQFGKAALGVDDLLAIRAELDADLDAAIDTLAARYAIPLDVMISAAARLRASVSRPALAAAGA